MEIQTLQELINRRSAQRAKGEWVSYVFDVCRGSHGILAQTREGESISTLENNGWRPLTDIDELQTKFIAKRTAYWSAKFADEIASSANFDDLR